MECSGATVIICLVHWAHSLVGCVNPPPNVHSTCDIAGCVQNISQNQPVQPVAICVSVMIAIALLHFCCKSYVATIMYEEATILWIFQLLFFKIQECVKMKGFPKSGHIWSLTFNHPVWSLIMWSLFNHWSYDHWSCDHSV